MENFGRYIAITGVLVLLFLTPIAGCKEKINRICELQAENLRVSYIEQVMKTRVISLAEWEAFCAKLNRYGGAYQIELSVGVPQSVQTEREPSDRRVYVMHYDKEIMEVLYQTGNYRLEGEAFVMLELHKTGIGVGRLWMRAAD